MATEYLKVLDHMGHEVVVVGRGETNLGKLKEAFPKHTYVSGGLAHYLANAATVPTLAINAISVNELKNSSIQLLNAGVSSILLEKPGALTIAGLKEMLAAQNNTNGKIGIGYNRRFYAAINRLKSMAAEDGGITSIHFEFTEWIHTIDENIYSKEALDKWLISNSSHVIDTVFYLAGQPTELHPIIKGKGEISWHPASASFYGSGTTDQDIPFTYHTDWLAPGRWAIEVLTNKRRYYLKPMEKLQVQQKGSVRVEEVEVDYELEEKFKPGLFLQTKDFLDGNFDKLVSIEEQISSFDHYYTIADYTE